MSEVESVPGGKMQSVAPFSGENATSGMNFIVIYVILSKSLSIFCFLIGCWFGRPNEEKVWLPGVTQDQLFRADSSTNAGELARFLTNILFSPEEIKWGNATKALTEGVELLDAKRLHAVHGMSRL